MKITKQNILQAIEEVKKEEKNEYCHYCNVCNVCFVNYLLKLITFDKHEPGGCMKVLRKINEMFDTTYGIYGPLCEYGDAVPYEPILKKLSRRVIPI